MRHRIAGKQLHRTSAHRRSMLRNLAAGLFEHGEIETTMPKAKAVQPFVERIITIAKSGTDKASRSGKDPASLLAARRTLAARRKIESRINDRMVHVWVADDNVPDSAKDNPYFDLPEASAIEFNRYGEVRKAPRLVEHIMTRIAERYRDRQGGYTRIVKLGRNRLGDGADLVLLQLVGQEEGPQVGGGTSGRRRQADRRTAYAAKLRKQGPSPAAVAEPAAPPGGEAAAPAGAGAAGPS